MMMASHVGITVFFFSCWIASFTTQDTFILRDINTLQCRIAGITLVSYKNQQGFIFTNAQRVCEQLGLRMAYKAEVDKAQNHGLETCRFGWVQEEYVVISRITPNQKCGQNKTGVVIWRTPRSHKGYVYCYNSSDTWINSCEPEESTTASLEVTTETNFLSTVLSQNTSAEVQTTESQQTEKPPKFRVICLTETFPPTTTTTEVGTLHLAAERTAFRNDGALFGGVPTALLVLALIFFVATVVLAVCYVKKYKKTFPFSKKEEKKIEIETKSIKETKANAKTSEQELKKNGKNAEESQAKPERAVRCLEAEV